MDGNAFVTEFPCDRIRRLLNMSAGKRGLICGWAGEGKGLRGKSMNGGRDISTIAKYGFVALKFQIITATFPIPRLLYISRFLPKAATD